MSTHFTKFANDLAFNTALAERAFDVPNVSLIRDTRKMKYTKAYVPGNIGIRGADGVCYSLADWQAMAPADRPVAVGAYIWDETHGRGFVIHGTINNGVSWGTQVEVPGITTVTSSAVALQDFGGAANTQAMFSYKNGGSAPSGFSCPVFDWAHGLIWAEQGLSGYLGAAGEIELIRLNLADINECRAAIGQDPIVFAGKNIWSSTQYSSYLAWSWVSTGWDYGGKNGACCALSLAAF